MNIYGRFVECVEDWTITAMILRLVIAMTIGIIIGIDRELKNRGAGIKTHVFVCVGSALVMMTSEYISIHLPDIKADIARMPAQVVSGVGFLGVGTIIVTGKNQIRGLTTAAGLWATACIGLAIGIGYVEGTLITFVIFLFTYKILESLDLYVHRHSRNFNLYVEFKDSQGPKKLAGYMRENNIRFSHFKLEQKAAPFDVGAVTFYVEISAKNTKRDFIEKVENMDYICYVEEF